MCAKLQQDVKINLYPCSCHSIVEQLQTLQSARKLHDQNSLVQHDPIIKDVVSCEGPAIPKQQPAYVQVREKLNEAREAETNLQGEKHRWQFNPKPFQTVSQFICNLCVCCLQNLSTSKCDDKICNLTHEFEFVYCRQKSTISLSMVKSLILYMPDMCLRGKNHV